MAMSSEKTEVRNFVLFLLPSAHCLLHPSYPQTSSLCSYPVVLLFKCNSFRNMQDLSYLFKSQVQVPKQESFTAVASLSCARAHLSSSQLCPVHQIGVYGLERGHREGQCVLDSFTTICSTTL